MIVDECEENKKKLDEMFKKKEDLARDFKEALEENKKLSEELVEENLRIQTIKRS